MEKIFKVRTVYMFEMDYLVKAEDEKEAAWMVNNLDSHDKIEGYEYNQRGLGHVVQKVKEISIKKAKQFIADANGLGENEIENFDSLESYIIHYNEDDSEVVFDTDYPLGREVC